MKIAYICLLAEVRLIKKRGSFTKTLYDYETYFVVIGFGICISDFLS
jgi:hypothetical protein